jgi:exo-1,4-beta-D-glucosaminidase
MRDPGMGGRGGGSGRCASAFAESAYAPTRVGAGERHVTAIGHWQMQSSAIAQESGAEISSTEFSTHDWYGVSGHATVMAGLLENGKYDNVFYGDNLSAVGDPDANGTPFVTSWWYRSEFTLDSGAPGAERCFASTV